MRNRYSRMISTGNGGRNAAGVQPSLERKPLKYINPPHFLSGPVADRASALLQKASTLRRKRWKRAYVMTAKRMLYGLVLKWRNRLRFIIR